MEDKKSNFWIWVTASVVALLAILFITNGFGLFTGGAVSGNYNFSIENSPVLGSSGVDIYIFSDFSCPACVYADKTLTPQIINDYVDTGKARLIFKYFPGHGQGVIAHEIALALNQQGLFWKFSELAYQNSAQTNNKTAMLNLAKSLGADLEKVNAYLDSNSAMAQLSSDIEMGKSNGVYATPTFFVGNKMITGVQDFSVFQKEIESRI